LQRKSKRLLGCSKRWDLFISYAHEDARHADVLAAAAARAGLIPWLDKQNLRFGKQFDAEIRDAIKHSGAFVLLLSGTATTKPYVSSETSQALAHQVPIVPVFVEKLDRHSLPTPFDQAAKSHGHSCVLGLSEERAGEIALGLKSIGRQRQWSRASLRLGLLLVLVLLGLLASSPRPPEVEATVLTYYKEGEKWATVRPNGEVATGEKVQFVVEPKTPGHLYVLWRDAAGTNEILFPKMEGARLSAGENPVQKGQMFVYPPGDGKGVTLTPPTGEAGLFVFLAKRRLPELEQALSSNVRIQWSATNRVTATKPGGIKLKGLGEIGDTGAATEQLIRTFQLETLSDKDVAGRVLLIHQTPPDI